MEIINGGGCTCGSAIPRYWRFSELYDRFGWLCLRLEGEDVIGCGRFSDLDLEALAVVGMSKERLDEAVSGDGGTSRTSKRGANLAVMLEEVGCPC